MSGSHVPYHLRPNKYIDRQIFFEWCRRIQSNFASTSYCYISMGGKYLEDLKVAHNFLHIDRLFSLEKDSNTLKRQEFNKPLGLINCLHLSSGEFIDGFDTWKTEQKLDDSSQIIWLDYTNPKEREQQLQEFSSLIEDVSEFSVVRITLNANVSTLGLQNGRDRKVYAEAQYRKLEDQLGDFFPIEAPADKEPLTDAKLTDILLKAVRLACLDGVEHRPNTSIFPISITRYNDGHNMLSVTCFVCKTDLVSDVMKTFKKFKLPLSSVGNWGLVHQIYIPDLSLTEKRAVDNLMHTKNIGPTRTMQRLGFHFLSGEKDSKKSLESYKELYKYYPHFFRAES